MRNRPDTALSSAMASTARPEVQIVSVDRPEIFTLLDSIVSTLVDRTKDKRQELVETSSAIVESQLKITASQSRHPALRFLRPFPASALRTQYTKDDVPDSFLHLLPGELRNHIYHLVGFPRKRQRLQTLEEPSLAEAIPSLRSEIHAMLLAESTFEVDVYSKFYLHSALMETQRVKSRGGRYGTGRLAINADNWLNSADNLAVRFHHICMHVCEMDGYSICSVFLNNTRRSKNNGPRMLMNGLRSQMTKWRIGRAKRAVHKYVAQLRRTKNFAGFSMQHLRDIAAIFDDPERSSS